MVVHQRRAFSYEASHDWGLGPLGYFGDWAPSRPSWLLCKRGAQERSREQPSQRSATRASQLRRKAFSKWCSPTNGKLRKKQARSRTPRRRSQLDWNDAWCTRGSAAAPQLKPLHFGILPRPLQVSRRRSSTRCGSSKSRLRLRAQRPQEARRRHASHSKTETRPQTLIVPSCHPVFQWAPEPTQQRGTTATWASLLTLGSTARVLCVSVSTWTFTRTFSILMAVFRLIAAHLRSPQ